MVEISTTTKIFTLSIFALYVIVLLGIGWYSNKKQKNTSLNKFVDEFYTGGRGMGALVVGLMVGASICSAGTFIGGPALGTKEGLVWTVVIYSSVMMNFFILSLVGKKIGIMVRRTNIVSYTGLLRDRYDNNRIVGILAPVAIIILLIPYCVSQFVGGARLFELMTGLDYMWGLAIFGIVIFIYAIFGGIRGVSLSAVLQGFAMTVAVLGLLFGVLTYINVHNGGLEAACKVLAANGELAHIIDPNHWTIQKTFSFMFLNGIAFIGLPHSVQATFIYKNTKSIHSAIVVGLVFVTMWQGIMTFMGPASRMMGMSLNIADQTTPALAVTTLPPAVAGVILAGAVGAIQSTVASMLLIISASAAKDLFKTYVRPKASNETMKKATYVITAGILVVILAFAVNPPAFLQAIINFALGGLESAFFCPLLLGLYWKKANEYGCIASMGGGLLYYLLATIVPSMAFGLQPVVPSCIVSILGMIIVSLLTPHSTRGTIMRWFGKKYPIYEEVR
ncbi:MAG: sodium/solute symporter [Ruthenibacterium sp.]